jgi:DNA modification methylase/ParB-like chromosome segregation protein Spo0J
MIQNKITLLPLDSIVIDRESRQRSTLPRITDLAYDIALSNWINPILVEDETLRLIAGERRYSAVTLLKQIRHYTLPETVIQQTPPDVLARLRAVSKCKVESLENWTKIPAQLGRSITPIDLALYEFRENAAREDLSWQDKAKAIFTIHSMKLREETNWTTTHTGRLLNMSQAQVSNCIQVWRAVTSGDERLARIVNESAGLEPAILALRRVADRRNGPLLLTPKPKTDPLPGAANGLSSQPEETQLNEVAGLALASPASATTVEAERQNNQLQDLRLFSAPPTLAEQAIICTDFLDFARSYSGEPFNFIHLDPPYGIQFTRGSTNQHSSADTRQLTEYDDSPETFWNILQALANNQHRLIADSAHLMLWYSQNYDREIMDFLDNNFNTSKRWTHRLIWHCSNMLGIMPDPQRTGRRTYETAFVLAFGDRKIAKPTSLSFSFPRTNKVHRSEKPVEVLSFWFPMFVDETSNVFDPTCGSASSLVAAHKCGARRVLGLEIDPIVHQSAVKYFNEEMAKC